MPGLLTAGCQIQDGKKNPKAKNLQKMPNPTDNTELPVSYSLYACPPIVAQNMY